MLPLVAASAATSVTDALPVETAPLSTIPAVLPNVIDPLVAGVATPVRASVAMVLPTVNVFAFVTVAMLMLPPAAIAPVVSA